MHVAWNVLMSPLLLHYPGLDGLIHGTNGGKERSSKSCVESSIIGQESGDSGLIL